MIKLRIDQHMLRENTYKTTANIIRDDYFEAPLDLNLIENIGDIEVVKDSFRAVIRMPRFEILTLV